MQVVRTILAVAIAAALALLPVGAAATGFAGTAGHDADTMQAASAGEMSPDMAMDDCCPDAKTSPSKDNPCQSGKCPLGFCVAPGIGLGEIATAGFHFPLLAATMVPIPTDQVVSLPSGSPPFRPPRV
jgi:hypothetical protein